MSLWAGDHPCTETNLLPKTLLGGDMAALVKVEVIEGLNLIVADKGGALRLATLYCPHTCTNQKEKEKENNKELASPLWPMHPILVVQWGGLVESGPIPTLLIPAV